MKIGTKFLLAFSSLLIFANLHLGAQCNGDASLCGKRFDEVCYATTHNAFNYQGAFLFPNQSFDISRQMQDGVRSLMLDVYWYNNRPTVYHSSNFLGNQPLSNLLTAIKTFLDQNPNEVLSIIFESYVTAAQMNDVFDQSGLLPYLHVQAQGSPWPTLDDMISNNQRLVIFSDVNDGQAYPWYHYVWDFAVETDYSANSRLDFNCNYNRGNPSNGLFILNHFITQQSLGYGLIDSALAVNRYGYLGPRAFDCWTTTGKLPNFLTVDFYEQGEVMAVKDAINNGSLTSLNSLDLQSIAMGPNPCTDHLNIQMKAPQPIAYTFYNTMGASLMTGHADPATSHTLGIPATWPNGLYHLLLSTEVGAQRFKFVVLR